MPLRATVVAAAVTAAAALTLSGQEARADVGPAAFPTCNATLGNLVATYKNGNWATLEVFWDNANGTNCAFLRHGSAAPSGKIFTFVSLWTCTTNTAGAACNPRGPADSRYQKTDRGNFESFAGKVVVDGRDRCIYAWGGVDTNGDGAADRHIDVNNSTNPASQARGAHCG